MRLFVLRSFEMMSKLSKESGRWTRWTRWTHCTEVWVRGNQGLKMGNSAMISSAFELSPENNSKNLAFVLNDFPGLFCVWIFLVFNFFVPTCDDYAS